MHYLLPRDELVTRYPIAVSAKDAKGISETIRQLTEKLCTKRRNVLQHDTKWTDIPSFCAKVFSELSDGLTDAFSILSTDSNWISGHQLIPSAFFGWTLADGPRRNIMFIVRVCI